MGIAVIKAETRKPGGRNANQRLRKRGMVPAVIYGHGKATETVALSHHDLLVALEQSRHVIKIEVEGQQQQYLLKDVQYDHLQKEPLHIDLMRVDATERVNVKVAIELRGDPAGVHEGGELIQMINSLDIECPLLDIPETLRIKVEHLGLGDALHVSDIELPEGVVAKHDPEEAIATVRAKRIPVEEEVEGEEEPAEGAAEPEVIGRTAKETEEKAEG